MAKVILVGEPMTLFMAQEEGTLNSVKNFTRSAAGAEMNVAIGLERLGHDVCYVTKLGKDPFGNYLLQFLKDQNIDTSCISLDKHRPTAFQLKGQTAVGDPEIAYYRAGSAASNLQIEDVEDIDMNKFDHFHLTGIFPAISKISRGTLLYLIEKAKNAGLTTSFDPNIRESLWEDRENMVKTINKIAAKCDIVLPGIEEGRILTGYKNEKEIADFYLEIGVKVVVIKLGAKGAFVKTRLEEGYVNGYPVEKIVDTVGAGDGFAVGYLSGLLEKCSIKTCVERANAIGAIQVMHRSDNEGLPTPKQLEEFMNK